MNTVTYNFNKIECLCCHNGESEKIAYVLFPLGSSDQWIEKASSKYGTSIVAISGMDWDNDLTPWPASGVPKGSPDFKGLASKFFVLLTKNIIPEIEKRLNISADAERSLIGISLSGLFTLWQWPQSEFFRNIATLSGSYWYEGFTEWIWKQSFSGKNGKCYMLLGAEESKSKDPMFRRVGECTEDIVGCLNRQGVDITFEVVPGNHYQHTIGRLDRAFSHIFKI